MDNSKGVFSVKVTLSPELQGLLSIGSSVVMQQVADTLNEVAVEGQAMIKADTPVRTGELQRSIKVNPARLTDLRAAIYSDISEAPYAAAVEFGIEAHNRPGVAMFRKNIPVIHQMLRQRLTKSLGKLFRGGRW